MQNKTNILLVDIENAPHKGTFWDGMFEQNILSVIDYGYLISFSFKWLGERGVHAFSLANFRGTRAQREVALLKKLHEVLDKADIVIAHNGDNFDIKKSNAYFIKHGFLPPSPFKTVDTLKIAKRYFKFNSNKLDYLADYLGVGRKIETGGFSLWQDCMLLKKEALSKMVKYNKHDVILLEKVYRKLLPWMANHPHVRALFGSDYSCPNCGSHDLQKRGFNISGKGKSQRLQCSNCGGWSSERVKKE